MGSACDVGGRGSGLWGSGVTVLEVTTATPGLTERPQSRQARPQSVHAMRPLTVRPGGGFNPGLDRFLRL